MPQQINLVVKNGTGVDQTFTALSPAAGDGGVALWALKSGTIAAAFPTLTAVATRNSNDVRTLRVKFGLPSSYNNAVTGLTVVSSKVLMDATFKIPADFPEALKDDWVAYATNLLNTALLKSMIRDGLSAT